MAAGKGGIGGMVKKAFMAVIVCGVILAVAKIFNYDPFGFVSWVWSWFSYLVLRIAHFLEAAPGFHRIFSKPK